MADDPGKIQSSPGPPVATWAELCRELARDVDRVADRLRGLSQARLSAATPPHGSRAEAARATAQLLADASAGFEASGDPGAPAWRQLPALGDFAVGEQVAVTGHDLVAAAHRAAAQDAVWARAGRRTAHEVLAAASDALAELRRAL
jgi:hypothetical protein